MRVIPMEFDLGVFIVAAGRNETYAIRGPRSAGGCWLPSTLVVQDYSVAGDRKNVQQDYEACYGL